MEETTKEDSDSGITESLTIEYKKIESDQENHKTIHEIETEEENKRKSLNDPYASLKVLYVLTYTFLCLVI